MSNSEKISIGEPIIIDSRYESSMSSTFRESLCIERIDEENYRLFIGDYEVIGEVSDYLNEETYDYDIPDTIDGAVVQYTEEDYICGGDILQNEDDGQILLQSELDDGVEEWLKGVNWLNEEILTSIKTILD
jgi:hypothetical protein